MVSDTCIRYSYEYESHPEEVRDYILRSADCAEKIYGRDSDFARFYQILDFARFLGWEVPRVNRSEMPDFLQELTPDAVNIIFENQAKLLVDISPIAEVKLLNGKSFPLRMVCSTTPAGDLVWKTHLLVDNRGQPYVAVGDKRFPVRTQGTQVVCNPVMLPYNEDMLVAFFDPDGKGVWPAPFLPELFSHHALAEAFGYEGAIEIVKIHEDTPLQVISTPAVPSFYRELNIDRTRALPMMDYRQHVEEYEDWDEEPWAAEQQPPAWNPKKNIQINRFGKTIDPPTTPEIEARQIAQDFPENDSDEDPFYDDMMVDELGDIPEEGDDDADASDLEDSDNNDEGDLEAEEAEESEPALPVYTNIVTRLSAPETKKLETLVSFLEETEIESKDHAKRLQENPETKDLAEKWLLTAVHRLTLIANTSKKVGAVMSLIQKHAEQPIIILQPRQKWAEVLASELENRGHTVEILHHTKTKSKPQIKRFEKGDTQILIMVKPNSDAFFDNSVVIAVTTLSSQDWLEWVNESHTVYGISIEELGLGDLNYIQDHPCVSADVEEYTGPGLSLFKTSDIPTPKIKKKKTAKPKKPKFVIKANKGRPAKADTLEKAIDVAKKKEEKGMTCEIKDPDGEVVYISSVGEVS